MSDPTFDELMDAHPSEALTLVVNIRTEAYDVYIGRPSIFGNPFHIGRDGTRSGVITKYREWLCGDSPRAMRVRIAIESGQLDNKRLGCFCRPLPCHGDVLRDIVLHRQGVGS